MPTPKQSLDEIKHELETFFVTTKNVGQDLAKGIQEGLDKILKEFYQQNKLLQMKNPQITGTVDQEDETKKPKPGSNRL